MKLIEERSINPDTSLVESHEDVWVLKDVLVDMTSYGFKSLEDIKASGFRRRVTELDFEIDSKKVQCFFNKALSGNTNHSPQYVASFEWPISADNTPLEDESFFVFERDIPIPRLNCVSKSVLVNVIETMQMEKRLVVKVPTLVRLERFDCSKLFRGDTECELFLGDTGVTNSRNLGPKLFSEFAFFRIKREFRGCFDQFMVQVYKHLEPLKSEEIKAGSVVLGDFPNQPWDAIGWMDEAVELKDALSHTLVVVGNYDISVFSVCPDFPVKLVQTRICRT